jgi:hypothetical protein
MLKHLGVSTWFDKLPLDKNNKFLGINDKNRDTYSKLPIEMKCV